MDDLFKEISKAIEQTPTSKLLKFGEFTITEKLGYGQQGLVVLAVNRNGKQFAIKFYRPTDEDPRILRKSKERFIREAKILLKLQHHNIAAVYKGGSATWNARQNRWTIRDTFYKKYEVLYYVMEYIAGKNVKSLFYKKNAGYKIDKSKCNQKNVNVFEQLILQAANAMAYFHSQGIAHRDIRPENIIFSQHDNTFIIVDFGFARRINKSDLSSSSGGVIRKTPYIDLESEQRGNVGSLADQYMFSGMLLDILEIFKPLYTPYNYDGIKSVLIKAMKKRKERYKSLKEFQTSIQQYLYLYPYHALNFRIGAFLAPEARFGNFKSKIRIPVSGSFPVFDEILAIIDTNDFQRLRGVRQLGPTLYVYPGANHSRFEHSLGTYHLSLAYLEVLLKNPVFREAIEPIDESTKLIVLAALLHDIGHYPYSHWIEEIGDLPNIDIKRHEERARDIIENGEIGKIIRKEWGVLVSKVCALIASEELDTKRDELMNSVIDSVIDVDRVDYLRRDGAHCGVPYGAGFDVERLISSLYVNEYRNKICLSEKGRSSFISFLISNIVMYQEVYWHKTVRACMSMFKRFFYEYAIREVDNAENIRLCQVLCVNSAPP